MKPDALSLACAGATGGGTSKLRETRADAANRLRTRARVRAEMERDDAATQNCRLGQVDGDAAANARRITANSV